MCDCTIVDQIGACQLAAQVQAMIDAEQPLRDPALTAPNSLSKISRRETLLPLS